MRWTILLFCAAVLLGGDPPARNNKEDAASGMAKAGKADAHQAFARQERQADAPHASGPGPILSGCYLWNGRADENYKPFFQWELRFKGGSSSAAGLRLRVVTLGPMKEIIHTGAWKALGTVPAQGSLDGDYRMNCPNPTAFRIEATWQGGSDQFLGWDRVMVPVSLGSLKDTALLACVGGNAEADRKAGGVVATWSLWNIGGLPLKAGAAVTVRFHNEAGMALGSEVWQQPKGEEIPANSARALRLVVRKAVPTDALSFAVNMSSAAGSVAGATNVDGVVVSAVSQQEQTLHARIRNGTAGDLAGLVVTLGFLDQRDKKIATLELPAIDLKVGAESEVQAKLAKPIEWAGLDMQWRTSGAMAPLASATPTAEGTLARIAVKGLELLDITSKVAAKGLTLRGRLHNATGGRLDRLALTFSVRGASEAVPIPVAVDELDTDQSLNLEFTAKGLEGLKGLEMSWTAGGRPR